MPLTILTNDQVKSILENLTLAQLDGFQRNLSKALHEYSTDVKAVQDGTYHQPQRTSYGNPQTGATTLFMPSVGPAGMGVKGKSMRTRTQMHKGPSQLAKRPRGQPF
ncbi:unnamed protein product [Parascedosporium putredinis]|uniref:Uncharacterized protein n=1 Tax=Parascedosporium putredinis TaxID=1442378 RepID=A0A9P1HCS0_9PEZI|nr:unnamed protein product [Parascedosporium putredinis]CAI8005130.1 unnamed protein product [Parascedosporium putredinis]